MSSRLTPGMGGVLGRALSVPLHIKILGIVALVAVFIGVVTIIQAREGVSRSLGRALELRALSEAQSLAVRVERPVVTGDEMSLRDVLLREKATQSELSYAVVYDRTGRVLAHSFQGQLPVALRRPVLPADSKKTAQRSFSEKQSVILEAAVPILGGAAGRVRLGLSSRQADREIATLTRRFWFALGVGCAIALALALLLTYLVTRPVRQLRDVAEGIGAGNLSARAEIGAMDEIGELAQSFNRMATKIECEQEELRETEQARLELLDALIDAQEEERKRIALDLHDELGATLSALLLELRGRDKRCNEICKGWDLVEPRLHELISQVRHMAWNLRPAVLDDYGLGTALKRQVAQLGELSDVVFDYCHTDTSGEERQRLPRPVEVGLYRIAQEAMTNVIRHAQATHASVVLTRLPASVVLIIEDDGIGGAGGALPHGDAERPSLGLRGMRERARALGGELVIESAAGEGTVVKIQVLIGQSDPEQLKSGECNDESRTDPKPAALRPAETSQQEHA